MVTLPFTFSKSSLEEAKGFSSALRVMILSSRFVNLLGRPGRFSLVKFPFFAFLTAFWHARIETTNFSEEV